MLETDSHFSMSSLHCADLQAPMLESTGVPPPVTMCSVMALRAFASLALITGGREHPKLFRQVFSMSREETEGLGASEFSQTRQAHFYWPCAVHNMCA